MSRAVVLANGSPPSAEMLGRALDGATAFVCADGGANAARALGRAPDAIIGDFDSVDAATLAHFESVPQVRNTDTETTDTEKAIEYLLGRDAYDEITILGGGAGRLDHVLGHVSLLRKFARRARVVLEDEGSRTWLEGGPEGGTVELDVPVGTTVSFFAVGAPAEGVATENFRYALTDKHFELGVQDSVSNVTTGRPARIRIAHGMLLVTVVTAAGAGAAGGGPGAAARP